jgi:hypothetical protein
MNKDKALDLALDWLVCYKDKSMSRNNAEELAEELITAIKQARSAPVQNLPFGVGGGLVAIKTLLSRDPCVHANTAIEMIDAILNAPAAHRQWVGLTDDEWQDLSDRYGMILFGRFKNEIETKLREKNTP